MDSYFYKLYNYISSRKLGSLIVLLGIVFGMLYLVSKIHFEEDISKLIPFSEDSKEFQKVLKSSNFSDKLVVNIQMDSEGSFQDLSDYATEYIDSITASSSKFIKNIQGRVSDEDLLKTMDFVNYKSILSPSGMITKNMILKIKRKLNDS